MPMSRRHLLRSALAVPFALPGMPGFASVPVDWRRHLVLVELNGGNDGLNTVVPYADPAYRVLRPRLALPDDQVLRLDERLGLHAALEPLMPLWIDRDMAIALGVGYPEPNFSHFRSIDIWETATAAENYGEAGWITRLFQEAAPPAGTPADGIVLGRNEPGPLAGAGARVIALKHLKWLKDRKRKPLPAEGAIKNPMLAHVIDVQNAMDLAERRLVERNLQEVPLAGSFPDHKFGRQMEVAARLIIGGSGVPVIKCSLGGFDTHAGQLGRHRRLLAQLAESLSAFSRAMKGAGRWRDVVVMTYAEFGRRPRENASSGTDHGTAAPHFVLGGRVRGGFIGEQPSLDHLVGRNMIHTLDFRELYAGVARNWWGLSAPFLGARTVPLIR